MSYRNIKKNQRKLNHSIIKYRELKLKEKFHEDVVLKIKDTASSLFYIKKWMNSNNIHKKVKIH